MIILAIETSCDDTCVAILKSKSQIPKSKINGANFEILSNIVSSQVKLHAKYGGVYPFLAKREHQKNLPIVSKKALKEAGNPKINLMALTVGPGLEPCLWAGVNFAKELAEKMNLPIIPVNHIEAHILANFVGSNFQFPIFNFQTLFPAICLVVSGGHTQLILMKDFGKYQILGETRDDAAGECFDKVARILGLGYPGGPAIASKAAKKTNRERVSVNLPRPMIYQKNYDFSFSGLKTAVLYDFKKRSQKVKISKYYIQKMCAEVQQAVIDVLINKTLKAAKNLKVRSIILGGGVAANTELRKQFKEKIEKEIPYAKFCIPDSKFCTDNAAMVAATAHHYVIKKIKTPKKNLRFPTGQDWKKIIADANLRI